MISETAFFDCENLPAAMSSRFDQPWTFIGEIRGDCHSIRCLCRKCSQPEVTYKLPSVLETPKPMMTVLLSGRLFITDDKIEVMVYFGACEECDSVYWARSGPPFRRVRAHIPTAA